MKNEFFFEIQINSEQVQYANTLVEYSIQHHPVTDIFANDPDAKHRQREFRFTGTLGEVVFADAYQLARPVRSFGAIDGQDYGQDFLLNVHNTLASFDIKTMRRKGNYFKTNYVLNLPAYQMRRSNVVTDFYFCISIHTNNQNQLIASFLGYVSKQDIEKQHIGILYKQGTKRVKDNGDSFVFQRDTYEVEFKDITSPIVTPYIEKLQGFKKKQLIS